MDFVVCLLECSFLMRIGRTIIELDHWDKLQVGRV